MIKLQTMPFWFVRSGILFYLLVSSPLRAQIVPDTTLPVSSSVQTQSNSSIVTGGTRAGSNLFHSFEQFSIPTGYTAYFNNASDIQNIISRVTGRSVSNIDGLIRANGTANLFLLNPNGIVFGPNAQLNIGGSFLASTASSLRFADGTQFSATSPQTTPLLTINIPIGLQFGRNPGRILVQGNGQGVRTTNEIVDTAFGLRVQPNQTLALVGGNIALEGGTLKTSGGRIELGSISDLAIVNLTPIKKGFSLGYEGVTAYGDIQLSGAAAVDASGVGGGDIKVRGKVVSLQEGSQIETSTIGSEPGQTLTVTASETVELIGTSANGRRPSGFGALVYPGATGNGSNLTIKTGQLIIRDGAQILANTHGEGSAGSLTINAKDSVELLSTSTNSRFSSGLFIAVERGATGNGSNLTIKTGRLIIRDGARISAGTLSQGSAGSLNVNAKESVELSGTSANGERTSSVLTGVQQGATGNGSNLTIKTERLIIRNGGLISSSTFSTGSAGSLNVNAKESVELSGTSADGQRSSGLLSGVQPGASRNGGDLTIKTGRLIIRDGGLVSVSTSDTGSAGSLDVNAKESVELSGTSVNGERTSTLAARTRGAGFGGNLTIETRQLTVRDGARVTVSSLGQESGNAGNLTVVARSISLNNQGEITAETESDQGGEIALQVQDSLLMRNNSSISTSAGTLGTSGNGGNITIDTGTLAALENSDITANSASFRGGNVIINAQAIFGTQFREVPTPESDITASGRTSELSGTVQINTPDIDPSRGLVELPSEVVDASRLIAQGCPAEVQSGASKFVVTGRGGLSENPNETLDSDAVQVELVEPAPESITQPSNSNVTTKLPKSQTTEKIVPAQGWVFNNKGQVTLVAYDSNSTTPQVPQQDTVSSCSTP